MDHHFSPGLAAAAGFIAGSVLVRYAGEAVALCAACAGLGALAGRYLAIVKRRPHRAVRFATAVGFFAGFGIAIALVVADLIIEAYS